MTPENEALIKDAKALIREAMHVKRFSGYADFVGQLCSALERSEARREELEKQLAARRVFPANTVAVFERVGRSPEDIEALARAESEGWNAR